MKAIPLSEEHLLLIDDEDFEEVSKYNWRVFIAKRRYTRNATRIIIKAFVYPGKGMGYYVYLSQMILKKEKHSTCTINFKDGNSLNWQRENLVVKNYHSNKQVNTARSFDAPWCPFGPATIHMALGNVRDEPCCQCDDTFNGPYHKCLAFVSQTFWQTWKRRDRDAS
jgi:hypothetical protein